MIVQPDSDDKLSQYSSLVKDFAEIEGPPEAYDIKIGLLMGGITEEGLEDELNAFKED